MANIFDNYGALVTAQTADKMKNLAFRFATIAAVSTGQEDYTQFKETDDFVAAFDIVVAFKDEVDCDLVVADNSFVVGVDLIYSSYRCCN